MSLFLLRDYPGRSSTVITFADIMCAFRPRFVESLVVGGIFPVTIPSTPRAGTHDQDSRDRWGPTKNDKGPGLTLEQGELNGSIETGQGG